MASQDNQVMQTATETVTAPTSDSTVKNVTGYIHFNKDDDLTKIFESLHQFRTSHRLKYYHHRNDFIFFSVKSDCLNELAKVQKFKISHYSSKSTYFCTKEVADKLVAVRDSFVRLSWDETEGTVQFLSRTIGRVHNELVRRVFKAAAETFERTNYHFVPHVKSSGEGDDVQVEESEPVPRQVTQRAPRGGRGGAQVEEPVPRQVTPRAPRGGRGGARGGRGGARGSTTRMNEGSNDGFTRVVRNKSKYERKVQVEGDAPRTRGFKQNTATA